MGASRSCGQRSADGPAAGPPTRIPIADPQLWDARFVHGFIPKERVADGQRRFPYPNTANLPTANLPMVASPNLGLMRGWKCSTQKRHLPP